MKKNTALIICAGLAILTIFVALLIDRSDDSQIEVASIDSALDTSLTYRPASTDGTATQKPVQLQADTRDDSINDPGKAGSMQESLSGQPDDDGTESSESFAGDSKTSTQDKPDTYELSSRVVRILEEVQLRQQEEQWEEALNEMNALYTEYDTLNPFEQVSLLNFYTNTLIRLQMWEESISAFSQMLTIPELRPDINARALMALGQLKTRAGETREAIAYYQELLTFVEGREGFEQQRERAIQQLEQLGAI